ncbi:hypothetical protein C8J57DRAFT_1243330 [Mycena rebaudengoi]|nr:hypothetical protein C8J57DRAFT_1243330 [Mycena rebaudengoi]
MRSLGASIRSIRAEIRSIRAEIRSLLAEIRSLSASIRSLGAATLPLSTDIALKVGTATLANAYIIRHDPAAYAACLDVLEQLPHVQKSPGLRRRGFKKLTGFDALRAASLVMAAPHPLPRDRLNLYLKLEQELVAVAGADGKNIVDALRLVDEGGQIHQGHNAIAHEMDVRAFLANVESYPDFVNKKELPAPWLALSSLWKGLIGQHVMESAADARDGKLPPELLVPTCTVVVSADKKENYIFPTFSIVSTFCTASPLWRFLPRSALASSFMKSETDRDNPKADI